MVASLAIGACAQSRLHDEILAAAQPEDWSQRLAKVDGARGPVAAILDAVADVRRGVAALYWARIAGSLLNPRREEVIACWRSEPEARVRRAAAFAGVSGIDWVGMYVTASAEERSHLEAVGSALETWDLHVQEDLRGQPGARREAATVLQRHATRAARARLSPAVELLRRLQGTLEELQTQMQYLSADAFTLASLLTDPEPAVRARGAAGLRKVMGLPLTSALAAALQDEPAPALWTSGPVRPVTDADVPAWIHDIEGGSLPPRLVGDCSALTPTARVRLATALIAAARRIPPDPPAGDSWRGFVHQPRTAEATRLFQLAASLGAAEAQLVLGVAMNEPSIEVVRRALAGLCGTAPSVLDPAGMAPMLLALLDHADSSVSESAAVVFDRMLGTRVQPQLRDQMHARARAIVAKEPADLTLARAYSFCGTGPEPMGPPKGATAQIVFTAARTGDTALLDPLIAELARSLPAPADEESTLHLWFVLSCLGELALRADAKQTRRLHELLSPELSPKQPALTALADGRGRRYLLVETVLSRIFPVVPEDLLAWYDAHLADRDACDWFAHSLAPDLDAVPEVRVRRIAPHLVRGGGAAALLIRTPDLLVEALHAGGERERIAAEGLAIAMQRPELVLPLVDSGALPREFVLAASAGRPLTLPDLSRLMPQGSGDGNAVARTVYAITQAPAGDAPVDLVALQQLGTSPVAAVAVAAAQRAAQQDGGRTLATAILERLFAGEDAGAASALEAAIRLGIGLQDLPARCTALFATTDWRRRMIVDAARLRFCGMDPRGVQSGYPADAIALAGIDVDAATLRAALGPQLHLHLPRLFHGCSAKTRSSALELCAQLPVWPEALEGWVVAATDNPDPGTRIAAYRALGSRDPELWRCALLVHEAQFDPDPDVRAAIK